MPSYAASAASRARQPSLQIRTFVLESGERVAHEREERRALVGDAQLVQPQAAGADRRFGAHDGETCVVGDLGRAEELLARAAPSRPMSSVAWASASKSRGLDGVRSRSAVFLPIPGMSRSIRTASPIGSVLVPFRRHGGLVPVSRV